MQDIVLNTNIRIETDPADPDHVWIHMIDPDTGLEAEGGQFQMAAFMDHVLKFYNDNY
jgi:hypothetical protein